MTAVTRMRRRFVVLGVLCALATAAIVSPAVGGPNFLTLPKAKKVFFTKKQTNSKFLRKSAGYTRGQADAAFLSPAEGDAAFLSPAEGDGRYLAAGGATTLQMSPAVWVDASVANDDTLSHRLGEAQFSSVDPDPGRPVVAAITLPSVLQDRPVGIASFELCYNAVDTGASISRVSLETRTATTANAFPSGTVVIDDQTIRDDEACRTYAAPNPVVLGPNTYADVVVRVNFTGPGDIDLGRLTVNLVT